MSLDNISYLSLREGLNPLATTYRDALAKNTANYRVLIWGIVSNAFKGIVCTFGSLYFYLWNKQRSVDNWTHATIYFSLTVLSLQAMWSYQTTTERLLFLGAKACWNNFILGQQSHLAVECNPKSKLHTNELFADLSLLFDRLTSSHMTELASYMRTCANHIKALNISNQLTILDFLHKHLSHQNIRLLFNDILSENLKKNLIYIISQDGSTFFPRDELENKLSPFFKQNQFTPNIQPSKIETYRDGLQLQKPFSCQFLKNLQLVMNCERSKWTIDTKQLLDDLKFLQQLTEGEPLETTQNYLSVSCNHWYNKILKGDDVSNHFASILELLKKYDHPQLKKALYLYYFRHYSINDYPHIHNDISLNMCNIIDLLFQNHSIHLVPAFLRLLAFNIKNRQTEPIMILCQKASQREQANRFKNIPSQDLDAARKEFMTQWEQFPLIEYLDICLAIHKCRPTDNNKVFNNLLLPDLDTAIPNVVYQQSTARAKEPGICEEILALTVERLPVQQSDQIPVTRFFDDLHLAVTFNFPNYKKICIKQILQVLIWNVGEIDTILQKTTEKQIKLFVDSLATYEGPPEMKHTGGGETRDKIGLYLKHVQNEANALCIFATKLKDKGHLQLFEACISYLKSKPVYKEAASQSSSRPNSPRNSSPWADLLAFNSHS